MDKRKILVVDDDEEFREMLKIYLELIPDCQVVAVADGHAALLRLQQQPFDLLLTDYHMPSMNGLLLAERVRQTISNIPIVLMTASFYGTEIFNKLRHLDQVGFLVKPFSLEQLQRFLPDNRPI